MRRTFMVAIALTIVAAAPAAIGHSFFRLNRTASVPVGVYRIVPHIAPYAAFCLPYAVLKDAEKAGLAVPSGECPNGKEPILKGLYRASTQVPITFMPGGFVINGRLLANTAPKERSKTGVSLTHHPFGSYDTGLWAISDYSPDSFDSRYFGPVADSTVRYYAVPFLLF